MELAWLFMAMRAYRDRKVEILELECKEFVKERQQHKLKKSVSRYECSPVDVLMS